MRRREFFSFAATGAALVPQAGISVPNIDDIVSVIEASIREQIPDIKKVQVQYNPDHPEMPLMIMAFKV